MTIKSTNTEPFFMFLKFHEDFDRNIKLAYGSLHAVEKIQADSQNDQPLIHLPTGSEPWGKHTKWRDVKTRIPVVARFLSQMGVVVVTSTFEDFLIEVKAEATRFIDFQTAGNSSSPGEVTGDRSLLENLFSSLKWNPGSIQYLLPLYDYFILARNCIVHRSGRASVAFVEHAESDLLNNSILAWPSKFKKALPELPQVQNGRPIQFLPRHAVLFAEVCLRAAREVNSRLVEVLGLDGMVYMAAFHSLLADDPLQTGAKNSVEQVVNHVLSVRYKVRLQDKHEVIRIMKRLGIWKECKTTHKLLFGRKT